MQRVVEVAERRWVGGGREGKENRDKRDKVGRDREREGCVMLQSLAEKGISSSSSSSSSPCP